MNIYLIKFFSNIQKNNNNILSFNKLLYPENIKTDHLKLKVGSDRHIEILIELFFLLHIFHEYSKEQKFLYTLASGSILGYLTTGSILPWDDDIDIVVPYLHFNKVEDLWNNKNNKIKKIWNHDWYYKNIKIKSYDVILLKHRKSKFFKLKLNINSISKCGEYQRDIGGLDIVDGNNLHNPLSKEQKKYIFGNNDNYYSDIFFYFEVRLLKKDIAEKLCNHLYPRWKEMKHPKLF